MTLLVIIFWFFNFIKNVIRESRYKVIPIMTIYILMLLLLLLWIYYSIMFIKMVNTVQLFPILWKFNLKLALGFVQSSINIELSITLLHNLRQMECSMTALMQKPLDKKKPACIRLTTLIVVVTFLVISGIVFIYYQVSYE